MSEIARHVWLNGEIRDARDASPSIASISLNIGTGVFDGMIAYWNEDHYNVFRAPEHLERLRVGAERMSLNFRWTTNDLLQAIDRLLEVLPPRTYYIRPLVLRAGPELFITGADALPVDLCIYAVLVGRDNDNPMKPWHRSPDIPLPEADENFGNFIPASVALFQSQASGPAGNGNLELLVHFRSNTSGDDLLATYFLAERRWGGPIFINVCGQGVTDLADF